jgi:hypothetical protein
MAVRIGPIKRFSSLILGLGPLTLRHPGLLFESTRTQVVLPSKKKGSPFGPPQIVLSKFGLRS